MDCSLSYAATLRSPREPLGPRPDSGSMGDRILVLLVFVLAAIYLFATSRLRVVEIGDPIGIKMYPVLIGIAAIVTGLLLVGEIVSSRRHIAVPANDTAGEHHPGMVLAVLGWILAYALVFSTLGYLISSILFSFGLLTCFHRGKWGENAAIAIIFSGGVYFAFTKLLSINLPRGLLAF